MPAAKAKVRRALTGIRKRMLVPQSVPGPSNSLERLSPKGPVDLVSQIADVDLHDVGLGIEREVPHVFDERCLRQHLAGAAHQELEECELLRCERNRDVTAPNVASGGVENPDF